MKRIEKAEALAYLGTENIFPAETQHFASTEKALAVANTIIARSASM